MKSALFILAFLFASFGAACKTTPTSPDSFYQAVVTCTEANVANPQAEAAVVQCLTDVVAGAYVGCLAGLVASGTWTVDEVACLVRAYATSAAVKVNNGTATTADSTALANANAWIRAEQVKYRRAAP
jgi:UDP-N-acetylglucosamine enolpyruvyl transferase